MKVAIIHDWLLVYGGAERVLEQLIAVFPEADLFSVVEFLPDNLRHFIREKPVKTTFIQKLPFAKTKYRSYLPLMPLAIEQHDLSSYDLIISSSHCVAKGVLTGPDQLHLCLCYSPIRYAWDLQHQYLKETNMEKGLKGWIARAILHKMRIWDVRTSNGVDGFIAISDFIARRIRKAYGRESTVIYPPVYVDDFQLQEEKEDFYLIASRMVPYKKMDLIVEAFAGMPDKKLVVIGDGPDYDKIRSKATPNVQCLGYQPFSVLHDHFRRAKAFVFAAEEDFGIIVLEAQACGTPVIAYGKGGALETVRGLGDGEKPTGLFFREQTAEAIRDAVRRFEANEDQFSAADCRENAQRFSTENFKQQIRDYVASQFELHQPLQQAKTQTAPQPQAAVQ